MATYVSRVDLTPNAKSLIKVLRAEHGELIFHQSGGCCDGSVPVCLSKDEFYLGSSDLHIGDIDECGFYMHENNFAYFKNTHITLDVADGIASGFSLENGSGKRFITKQRLFTSKEETNLFPVDD